MRVVKKVSSEAGGIVDVLADLQEKAQTELDEARKKEQTALSNFQLLKQSLDDQIRFAVVRSAS